MMIRNRHFLVLALTSLCLSCSGCTPDLQGEYTTVTHVPQGRTLTRLIWQDRETKNLKWADLQQIEGEFQLSPQVLSGFPDLDVKRQELVQMECIDGTLLVGVRDDDGGKLNSGWVAIQTGVSEELHGDHSDFQYPHEPRITRMQVDTDQGNPAHLYVYDRCFYLANDRKNGFTALAPGSEDSLVCRFHQGGGGHITLAAVDHRVGYSTWIAGGGPTKGRVDVVDLSKTGEASLRYSIALPSGGIHGATTSCGKVFFAPGDGICWVQSDTELKENPESVEIHHISLGTDNESERPLRTGAFTTHLNWVLCTTGRGASSAFCLINAEVDEPTVIKLPIETADGLSLTPPEVVRTASGKRYAFLFQDRREGEVPEQLVIVDLDPNGDRDLSDAKLLKLLPVGNSHVEGHYGHHSIAFDGDGRWAIISNPGDGELQLLSLRDLEFQETFSVGGMPTKVIAEGGLESDH